MNQGVYSLAASMINQINRVDVISNNLANANSNGFKQEGLSEGSFNNYLKKAEEANIAPTKLNTVLNTIPKIDSKYINNMSGPIVPTANELDFALNDRNAFFKVKNEKGEITIVFEEGIEKLVDKYKKINNKETLTGDYERGFLSNGLWSVSRHPNFVSEQLIWVTFYLF